MFPEKLNDISSYNEEMCKSLDDKIWFINHIPVPDSIIDYGCADGQLIRRLRQLLPQTQFIGYDISKEQLALAKQNNPSKDVFFTEYWGNHPYWYLGTRRAVICNSVTHEVYHYGNHADTVAYWLRLFNSDFDYVIIRDMALSRYIPLEIKNFLPSTVYKIARSGERDNLIKINDICRYGDDNVMNAINFLMKYRYTENWEREVQENYFPLTVEDYFDIIRSSGYKIVHHDHYALPFNVRKVKEDFGIDISDLKTHVKFVLAK